MSLLEADSGTGADWCGLRWKRTVVRGDGKPAAGCKVWVDDAAAAGLRPREWQQRKHAEWEAALSGNRAVEKALLIDTGP